MNQYQKTTEKKKQAIIQAALQLFKEKGFKDTSIKSIAEVAEVSPVSIYNYFGGKDNLVALCVNDLFEEIAQQADNILNSDLDFKTKLNQAFSLCQEKMSQQISEYFQDKMVEDSVFSTLLTRASNFLAASLSEISAVLNPFSICSCSFSVKSFKSITYSSLSLYSRFYTLT